MIFFLYATISFLHFLVISFHSYHANYIKRTPVLCHVSLDSGDTDLLVVDFQCFHIYHIIVRIVSLNAL